MSNYSDFLIKQGILVIHNGYDSTQQDFFLKTLEMDPPYSYAWKGTYVLECLVNSKAANVTETPAYTSHLWQKRGKVYH